NLRLAEPGFFSDNRRLPSGQRDEPPYLLLATLSHALAVRLCCRTFRCTCPGMSKDVPPLEIRSVARFLKNELLRKVGLVVPDVQPRQEEVGGIPRIRRPVNTQPLELFVRQRICGARVAPAHVPRVFEENGAPLLVFNLTRKHRFVEARKLGGVLQI